MLGAISTFSRMGEPPAESVSQIQQYVPVLILFLVAAGFAFGMIAVSVFVGNVVNKWRRKHLPIKDIAYECGMLPVGEGNTRLSVKFYLVAMLFILFDIEVVFLFPWAVVFKTLSWSGFWSILIFIFVLGAGYVYAWRKGAFQWE